MSHNVVMAYSDVGRQQSPPDLHDAATRKELSGAAIVTVAGIFDLGRLTNESVCDLLGGISDRTWQRWKRQPDSHVLDQDQLTRASLIIGIHRALRTLYSKAYADAWPTIDDEFPLFDGRSPVRAMSLGGIPVMHATRQLLDGWRGAR